MQSRIGTTLLEVLVTLTILVIITGAASLPGRWSAPEMPPDVRARRECAHRAVHDRRAVTVHLMGGFVVCGADGSQLDQLHDARIP